MSLTLEPLTVRPLGPGDTPAVRRLCEADPIANVFLQGRLEQVRSVDPSALGGRVLGCFEGASLTAAYWLGANIIPVGASPETNAAVAARISRVGRYTTSIIGPSDAVLDLSRRLPAWGEPQWVRAHQPLMAINGPAAMAPDPQVRPAKAVEHEALFRAAVEMFIEEVGQSPIAHGEQGFRSRISHLIGRGESFVRMSADLPDWPARGAGKQVAFKADVGVASASVAQIQGVWVHPALRGHGLATPAMAAVVQLVRRRVAPIVSLYVNDFNIRAMRTYQRAGFRQVGTFATVMY